MDGNLIDHLKSTVANLESQIDHLEAELAYIHKLLMEIGFPEGVHGLKSTIEELLDIEQHHPNDPRDL